MPELPEVETVKRGLESVLKFDDLSVQQVLTSDKKLRYQSPVKLTKSLAGQKWLRIKRKAKYLLFEMQDSVVLSHLGMTGSWRIEKDQRKHDHIRIFLSDDRILTYNDPRRFGMFEVLDKSSWMQDPRISQLGLDPVVDKAFTGEFLFEKTRKSSAPIKTFIMNQKYIVGVGNIYASEALFLAGIHPLLESDELTMQECQHLVASIKEVLRDAIEWGGTTISDFRQAGGSEGYFQNLLMAYGRDKEPCLVCGSMLVSQAIVGRNSFWCPRCQKL